MAKYEVIARGIFVKRKGKMRELQIGEVIETRLNTGCQSCALCLSYPKTFEVATPGKKKTMTKPKRRRRTSDEDE